MFFVSEKRSKNLPLAMEHTMHSHPADEAPWVLLYTTNTVWEAELVRGYLVSNGVEAVVVSHVDTMRGLTVGMLAIAKVYVPAPQHEQAQQLLTEYQQRP
jgi:hypothetical protein